MRVFALVLVCAFLIISTSGATNLSRGGKSLQPFDTKLIKKICYRDVYRWPMDKIFNNEEDQSSSSHFFISSRGGKYGHVHYSHALTAWAKYYAENLIPGQEMCTATHPYRRSYQNRDKSSQHGSKADEDDHPVFNQIFITAMQRLGNYDYLNGESDHVLEKRVHDLIQMDEKNEEKAHGEEATKWTRQILVQRNETHPVTGEKGPLPKGFCDFFAEEVTSVLQTNPQGLPGCNPDSSPVLEHVCAYEYLPITWRHACAAQYMVECNLISDQGSLTPYKSTCERTVHALKHASADDNDDDSSIVHSDRMLVREVFRFLKAHHAFQLLQYAPKTGKELTREKGLRVRKRVGGVDDEDDEEEQMDVRLLEVNDDNNLWLRDQMIDELEDLRLQVNSLVNELYEIRSIRVKIALGGSLKNLVKDSEEQLFNYLEEQDMPDETEMERIGVLRSELMDVFEQGQNVTDDIETFYQQRESYKSIVEKTSLTYESLGTKDVHYHLRRIGSDRLDVEEYCVRFSDIMDGIMGDEDIPVSDEEVTVKEEERSSHACAVRKLCSRKYTKRSGKTEVFDQETLDQSLLCQTVFTKLCEADQFSLTNGVCTSESRHMMTNEGLLKLKLVAKRILADVKFPDKAERVYADIEDAPEMRFGFLNSRHLRSGIAVDELRKADLLSYSEDFGQDLIDDEQFLDSLGVEYRHAISVKVVESMYQLVTRSTIEYMIYATNFCFLFESKAGYSPVKNQHVVRSGSSSSLETGDGQGAKEDLEPFPEEFERYTNLCSNYEDAKRLCAMNIERQRPEPFSNPFDQYFPEYSANIRQSIKEQNKLFGKNKVNVPNSRSAKGSRSAEEDNSDIARAHLCRVMVRALCNEDGVFSAVNVDEWKERKGRDRMAEMQDTILEEAIHELMQPGTTGIHSHPETPTIYNTAPNVDDSNDMEPLTGLSDDDSVMWLDDE